MSFATSHLTSCVGELYKSKNDTGDFSLSCQGKVIKAHSFILGMGLVLELNNAVDGEVNVILFSGLSISRQL